MAKRSATSSRADLPGYRAKRDFNITSEPAPQPEAAVEHSSRQPIFVVQKHAARRLHWDFRLEHAGVLWSWAVPKGPSSDPADKRLAVHVEDHPLDYADFQGTIPEGQYGAGTVETWDRGTWTPRGDPEQDLAAGELKFTLHGQRLSGGYVLVRLKPRGKEQAENWLLIKEHDESERPGGDAAEMERTVELSRPQRRETETAPPAPAAIKGTVPQDQRPQLALAADDAPDGENWLNEIKFDGYRLLLFKTGDVVRIVTRNGHDWTNRLPALAETTARLQLHDAVLDGELVAQREDGITSFALLQKALADRKTAELAFYAFDLLQLNGWDLRPCRLEDRKSVLQSLDDWCGRLRYSDHHRGQGAALRLQACSMGLEGIIAKQADAPYRPGRGHTWRKVKCQGREEFVVLGWTPPEGTRTGLGSLHVGYYDDAGALHYAGGVGTGFTERELTALRGRLDGMRIASPPQMRFAEDPPERSTRWVRPELVAEVQYADWSAAGRLRHAVYLGLREDKVPQEVVRPVAIPEAERQIWPRDPAVRTIVHAAPVPRAARPRQAAANTMSPAPRLIAAGNRGGGGHLTHPERELWPEITKQDLADYWDAVAEAALPEIANRPLAVMRCPDGIDGQHFFQKHLNRGFPDAVQEGEADGAPYLFIKDADGLRACAQVAAIELHGWGSRLEDPLHPDRLVFDLDPGEDVGFEQVVQAALDLRKRLKTLSMVSFCRTTGGKGLHVVVPVKPVADWDRVRGFCKSFAEALSQEQPERFVATLSKAQRKGRILIDWLRNGLGSTAVVSFSPRARPGAGVATRLHWREVTAKLDPTAFTLRTVPDRLKRLRSDPWTGFEETGNTLPETPAPLRRRR